MTIVVTGGGSGGHITPVLAVADELKQLQSDGRVVYIGQKGDGLGDLPAQDPNIDKAYAIQAGKLRRYHGEGWKQLLDVKTVALNIRDMFRVLAGTVQAWGVLRKERPSVIFVKGGFVGVPVGLAAALLKIPYVTHDSDAIPGLANRIIARWAAIHAVALPAELYPYPKAKTVTVGVPTHRNYQLVTPSAQKKAKISIHLPDSAKVLLITGGGLGAQRINTAMTAIAGSLLEQTKNLVIVHTAGRANEATVRAAYDELLAPAHQGRVVVLGYTNELSIYSAAADLIVARAGATAIAEFAVQGKACVLVPNPYLTAGHQLKNAQVLAKAEAVALLEESALQEDLPLVESTISALLDDVATRELLARNLARLANPHAAHDLADLLLTQAKKGSGAG